MSTWSTLKTKYMDHNLKIFPIQQNGKTPMIERWQEQCSSDYFQILYWYENCRGCNWGLPATQNNLFIIDLDVHDPNKNGVTNFASLLYTMFDYDEMDEFEWFQQETPSGGMHIIFRTDDELRNVANGSNVFKDYPGIDIRTDGYIVVEPSSIDGKSYKYINDVSEIPTMPDKLKKYILENVNLKNSSDKVPYQKPKNVERGDRDNQLYSYINNIYYKTRLDFDEILVLANHFNENILEEPFSEKVVKYKVKKVFEKDRNGMIFIRLYEE